MEETRAQSFSQKHEQRKSALLPTILFMVVVITAVG